MNAKIYRNIFSCEFSGLTAISTYLLTKELWNDRAGLFAACFISIGKHAFFYCIES